MKYAARIDAIARATNDQRNNNGETREINTK
jgi:hypothetical protein